MGKILQRIELLTNALLTEQEVPMTVTSIGQLAMILSQMGVYKNTYFRGQANINWRITPSLVRQKATLDQILDKEQKLIKDFKDEVKAANLEHLFTFSDRENPIRTEWEWLDQMQHHGVPTRLIDWTSDYENALYFATEDKTQDDKNGVIYFVWDNLPFMTETTQAHTFENSSLPWLMERTAFFNMRINYNDNRLAQSGKFTVLSNDELFIAVDENDKFKDWFLKIIIPKEAKENIRKELSEIGINEKSIYPAYNNEIANIVNTVRTKNGFKSLIYA
jgi:hypothetical protein